MLQVILNYRTQEAVVNHWGIPISGDRCMPSLKEWAWKHANPFDQHLTFARRFYISLKMKGKMPFRCWDRGRQFYSLTRVSTYTLKYTNTSFIYRFIDLYNRPGTRILFVIFRKQHTGWKPKLAGKYAKITKLIFFFPAAARNNFQSTARNNFFHLLPEIIFNLLPEIIFPTRC